MPEICRFFGIISAMYAKDHLPPHFRAKYGNYPAFFRIEDGDLIEGNMPGEQSDLSRIGLNYIKMSY